MHLKPHLLGVLTLSLVLGLTATAGADMMLGSTATPTGSSNGFCQTNNVIAALASDASTPYTVPATAGGRITRWETNTTGASAGQPVTLLVLRPDGTGNYGVVGTDSETLPTPLPADGIASFPLATPILVSGGETLGLYTNSNAAPVCYFFGGSTPMGNKLVALTETSPPASGQSLSPSFGNSPPGFQMNVSARLVSEQDAGVLATAGPPGVTAGNLAQLTASVSNGGPGSGPITFTDTVPAGLTINSAVAGSGTCSIVNQQVTCTISNLAPAQNSPVEIAVTPTAAGTYVNRAAVAPATGVTDPNSTNDAASATLAVAAAPASAGPPPPPPCVVPPLTRTPLPVAARVLVLLGCKLGSVNWVHTKSIAKGMVFVTAPGPGTYGTGRLVSMDVSSGPRKQAHRRTRRRGSRHATKKR